MVFTGHLFMQSCQMDSKYPEKVFNISHNYDKKIIILIEKIWIMRRTYPKKVSFEVTDAHT